MVTILPLNNYFLDVTTIYWSSIEFIFRRIFFLGVAQRFCAPVARSSVFTQYRYLSGPNQFVDSPHGLYTVSYGYDVVSNNTDANLTKAGCI
jgi:hypothetical protein